MDEISFADKNKKFKSFGNEQICQFKKHAPGLNSGQVSSFKLQKGAKLGKFIGECQLCMQGPITKVSLFEKLCEKCQLL